MVRCTFTAGTSDLKRGDSTSRLSLLMAFRVKFTAVDDASGFRKYRAGGAAQAASSPYKNTVSA